MTHPATETKIELVTESLEALVLATVVATTSTKAADYVMNHQNIVDAREVLSKALRELLTPTLRVVQRTDRVGDISQTLTVAERNPA